MTIPGKCIKSINHVRIRLVQKGKSLILKNDERRRLRVIEVDNCAITAGERCDFLVDSSGGRELFVELKGSDIRKAVSQIHRTISILSSASSKELRSAAIVSSRVPAEDSSTMLAKRKLIKSLVSRLYIKNRTLQLRASEVL